MCMQMGRVGGGDLLAGWLAGLAGWLGLLAWLAWLAGWVACWLGRSEVVVSETHFSRF